MTYRQVATNRFQMVPYLGRDNGWNETDSRPGKGGRSLADVELLNAG